MLVVGDREAADGTVSGAQPHRRAIQGPKLVERFHRATRGRNRVESASWALEPGQLRPQTRRRSAARW